MATYIVGDIQGCYKALRRLLDKVEFSPSRDTLYAVGDLIARGPESLETLEYLHSLGGSFDTVLGNHDLHFLAIAEGIKRAKSNDKLDPLLKSKKLPKYVHWLRQKPLAMSLGSDNLLVHAGLYPKWSCKKALSLSREIEACLQSKTWTNMLSNMYGSEPSVWHSSLQGFPRQRFIINALTRMRFLTPDLGLEFDTKTPPRQAEGDLLPWFKAHNDKLKNDQRVFFGHWAALMGKTHHHQYLGLDTGYVWGHSLTLYHLEANCRVSIRSEL